MEYPSLDIAKAGAMRFNTDSSQLEIYDGNQWVGISATSPDIQTGGTRGVLGAGRSEGGASQTKINNIQYINIATTGNAIDFGDATYKNARCSGQVSSRTRGILMRTTSPADATMDFITIASTGNAQEFGEDTIAALGASCSSETRGINMAGEGTNSISYITIATTGNSIDFGDVFSQGGGGGYNGACGVSSPTRGIAVCGRIHPSPNNDGNSIEFITIASTGNGADFGDLTSTTAYSAAAGNSTRGLVFSLRSGGSPAQTNMIDYINIATLGNSARFGELARTNSGNSTANNGTGVSSPTRAVYCGGYGSPAPEYSVNNTMEFVQIMTEGNSVDFGDLVQKVKAAAVMSNGHGGL